MKKRGMFTYIEYISRLPGVSLDDFYEGAAGVPQTWDAEHDDQLLLNIGRTWRVGPLPEYLHVWYNPSAGIERLDHWQHVFSSGEADTLREQFGRVGRVDRAGLYIPLLEPIAGSGGPYYGEYFDFAPGATREGVCAFYGQRRIAHPEWTLNLLVDRLCKLGPEPRGLAVWSLLRFEDLDSIAADHDASDAPIRLVTSGLYADLAKEIL